MKTENLWDKAKDLDIRVSADITGGFSVGFDKNIPETTQNELIKFVYWVEDNFNLPVTLWVDFKYNHYLIDRNKKRVGYCFYWVDFENYPVFDNDDNIPVIELPVRTEYWTAEEILTSFIEAITRYFAWLANMDSHSFTPDPALTEEILQRYLQQK
ncbi:MAG: hypothetical protein IKA47_04835 [Oscillospiraceae bacterium]|nr:hypothetical protein [Oscillospiraceae bacterium]